MPKEAKNLFILLQVYPSYKGCLKVIAKPPKTALMKPNFVIYASQSAYPLEITN